MKGEYEEMMRTHGRLCNEVHSCVECVYNKANGHDGGVPIGVPVVDEEALKGGEE